MRLFLLLFLTCILAAHNAAAKTYEYAVYGGGFHIVDAGITLDVTEDRYQSTVSTKTHGFLAKFVPWSGTYSSEGSVKLGAFTPNVHENTTLWKGDKEVSRFDYQDGNLVSQSITEGDIEKPKKNFEGDLTKGVTDILSATVQMLYMTAQNPEQGCNSESLVYDGKRRFDMEFRQTGTENLTANKYNIYDGQAYKCEVEITPNGGKWREKPRGWLMIQEQGRKHDALPLVWVGKMQGSETAVPVKLRVKTDYGTFMMHLVGVSED